MMEHKQQNESKVRYQETLDSLRTARRNLLSTSQSPLFRQLAETEGVDLEHPDHTNADYWDLLAGFNEAQVLSRPDDFKSPLIETITGYTPAAIMHSEALQNHSLAPRERRGHKKFLSQYNQRIRSLGESYPTISASGLTRGLNETALATVASDSKRMQTTAEKNIPAIVRGAQHELGFTQIIDSLGFDREPTTLEDDLAGADVFIRLPDISQRIAIDIKASLDEIDQRNHGSNGLPFKVAPNGQITMYSCLTDRDFNDSFAVPEQVAADRSPIVLQALFIASKQIESLRTR